jgi:hypothetical protein
MTRALIPCLAVAFIGVTATARIASAQAMWTIVDFEHDPPGSAPAGFHMVLTGAGRPGIWLVVEDSSAPSGRLVLARGDLFVICNHNLREIQDRWRRDSNELLFKLQYTFRR